MLQYTSGVEKLYPYEKIRKVVETDSCIAIDDGENKLVLSRVFLKKEAADILREELIKRCPGIYESEKEGSENVIIMGDDGTRKWLDERKFLRYTRYLLRFRSEHSGLIVLYCASATLLAGLICWNNRWSKIILAVIVAGIFCFTVLLRAAVYGLTVRNLKKFHSAGKPSPGQVIASAEVVSFLSGRKAVQIPINRKTLIRETEDFFVVRNLTLIKKPGYDTGIDRMRKMYRDSGLCRYEYVKIDEPGIRGWRRNIFPYLGALIFSVIFLSVYGRVMPGLGYAYTFTPDGKDRRMEQFLEDLSGSVEDRNKQEKFDIYG